MPTTPSSKSGATVILVFYLLALASADYFCGLSESDVTRISLSHGQQHALSPKLNGPHSYSGYPCAYGIAQPPYIYIDSDFSNHGGTSHSQYDLSIAMDEHHWRSYVGDTTFDRCFRAFGIGVNLHQHTTMTFTITCRSQYGCPLVVGGSLSCTGSQNPPPNPKNCTKGLSDLQNYNAYSNASHDEDGSPSRHHLVMTSVVDVSELHRVSSTCPSRDACSCSAPSQLTLVRHPSNDRVFDIHPHTPAGCSCESGTGVIACDGSASILYPRGATVLLAPNVDFNSTIHAGIQDGAANCEATYIPVFASPSAPGPPAHPHFRGRNVKAIVGSAIVCFLVLVTVAVLLARRGRAGASYQPMRNESLGFVDVDSDEGNSFAAADSASPRVASTPTALHNASWTHRAIQARSSAQGAAPVDATGAPAQPVRPAYWQYQGYARPNLVDEGTDVCTAVEVLMNATAQPDWRQPSDMLFTVPRVQRVEIMSVWLAYHGHRRSLADSLVRSRYSLPRQAQMATMDFTYPIGHDTLNAAAGEVFLFHGSREVASVATSGFDVRNSFRSSGARYGKGLYFAESAIKADMYVPAGSSSRTMVLARVLLGRCQVVQHERWGELFLPEVPGVTTPEVPVYYDSILAEQPGMLREVVVGENCHTYPELLITYTRTRVV